MPFRDREEAGRRLAESLDGYPGTRPLVLAIPRGAVPMARIVADGLGGDLDVALVHEVGAPGNPEDAIGAVDEAGHVELRPDVPADDARVQREVQAQVRPSASGASSTARTGGPSTRRGGS